MRYGILGGGFGLYGYLPAVAGMKPDRITTLEQYRATIRKRPELAEFEGQINFVDNARELLEQSDAVIVARRPADQELLVKELPLKTWKGNLLLEKPLARNPEAAIELRRHLQACGISYLEGFSILETDWAREFVQSFRQIKPTSVRINWRFQAHHYQNNLDNWKRRPEQGGGALRFYAIHFLALLAMVGEWRAVSCAPQETAEEDPKLDCVLRTAGCEATLACDSRWTGKPGFEVEVRRGSEILTEIQLANPFAAPAIQPAAGAPDPRIIFLQRLLRRLGENRSAAGSSSADYLRLWSDLEKLRRS